MGGWMSRDGRHTFCGEVGVEGGDALLAARAGALARKRRSTETRRRRHLMTKPPDNNVPSTCLWTSAPLES
jgi:hypothetical protein